MFLLEAESFVSRIKVAGASGISAAFRLLAGSVRLNAGRRREKAIERRARLEKEAGRDATSGNLSGKFSDRN